MAVPVVLCIWNMPLFMTEKPLIKQSKIFKINLAKDLSHSSLKPKVLHQTAEQSSNTRPPLCFTAGLTQ